MANVGTYRGGPKRGPGRSLGRLSSCGAGAPAGAARAGAPRPRRGHAARRAKELGRADFASALALLHRYQPRLLEAEDHLSAGTGGVAHLSGMLRGDIGTLRDPSLHRPRLRGAAGCFESSRRSSRCMGSVTGSVDRGDYLALFWLFEPVECELFASDGSSVGSLTEFFNVTSTRIRAYHRAKHRLGRPRRALNTT